MTNFIPEPEPVVIFHKSNIFIQGLLLFVVLIFCLSSYIYFVIQPPKNFPQDAILEIEPGMSMTAIAKETQDLHIITSDLALYIVMTYWHDPTTIHAGRYVFEGPTSLFGVAEKLARREVDMSLLSLTLPEGIPLKKIADIADIKLVDFDKTYFLNATDGMEGYFFPDTYFVPETFSADDLIELQKSTYETKIAPLREQIAQSDFTEYEVLILASIIEREANDVDSMKLVSSVLQNRLSIGMALQADASIEYALDKPLSELTSEDLKIDSPYNTYLYAGLPPTPIGNPGLQAIEAVLEPTSSNYFYYITDDSGEFHYAETFNQHKANVAKYLRN